MMARVLIADDHAVVRAGLRQFLVEDRSIREVGEAATGQQPWIACAPVAGTC